jgi:hypothetical protein
MFIKPSIAAGHKFASSAKFVLEPSDRQNRSVSKKFAIQIGLLLLSTLLTLAVAEGFARLVASNEIHAFFTPFEHDDRGYRITSIDPKYRDTLSWYKPGGTGITGKSKVRINNLGLRDAHDYPVKKPPGCYRVLGIGDSMTFGKGVEEKQSYLGVLEKRLRERYAPRCVEVLNAGMPNTNFYIQWLHLVRHWASFKPDHVLWGFFVYNDTQIQGEEEPYSMAWMEFIDRNPWLKKLALVQWAYYHSFFSMGAKGLEEGLPRYYEPEYPGWIQFLETLNKLRGFAKTEGLKVTFALIPIPSGYDEYPYREYHTKLQKVFKEHGFDSLDLVNGFESVQADRHWVHPSDGHPDVFLHKQMAIYIEGQLPWDRWLNSPGSL